MKTTQARTEHGEYLFKVSERDSPDHRPWISTEPRQAIPALESAFIGFELRDGMTFEQARKVADFMNKNLASMSLTMFDTHPLYDYQR